MSETLPKTIIRVEKSKDNPFVMIDRRPLEKPYLSWKAKGLLAYLLSRPDNWQINFSDLVKRSTDGEDATRAAAKELENAGHLSKEAKRRKDGTIEKWVYTVYEAQPLPDFPDVAKPDVENPDINDTDINDRDINDIKNGADAPKLDKMPLDWKLAHDQEITERDLGIDIAIQASDTAWLICNGHPHLAPLAEQFMVSRGILLSVEKRAGHIKALKEMHNAKPHPVQPRHVKEAIEKLSQDGMTIKDLYSVIGTAVSIANPPPGAEPATPELTEEQIAAKAAEVERMFTDE